MHRELAARTIGARSDSVIRTVGVRLDDFASHASNVMAREREVRAVRAAINIPLAFGRTEDCEIRRAVAVVVSRNRNISDEVLRIIGTTPELTKSYVVKKNLVENPKTPVMIATRMVTHLRESDLRQIAKSKNVTSPVQDAARRHLDRRKS